MRISVSDIRWERVWMVLTLREETGRPIPPVRCGCLLGAHRVLAAELTPVQLPEGRDTGPELRLNVTNAGNCRCITPGVYELAVIFQGEEWLHSVAMGCPAGEKLFFYGKQGGCYSLRWESGASGRLRLTVHEERPGRRTGIRGLYALGMRRFLQTFYRVAHRLPAGKKRRLLLLSEQNDRLDENLKTLWERLEERGLTNRFSVEASCRVTVTEEHLGIRSWLLVTWKLARAKVIFLDDHAPILDWLLLAKDVTVVQLWHAGVGFKSSGYSRWECGGGLPPFSGHRQYTYGVCTAAGDRELFAEIWGINPEMVLPAGMPRLDRFLDPGRRDRTAEELYRRFPACRGKRVILFAPTYRGRSRMDAAYPFERIDFEEWHAACGENSVVLVRMHPWVKEAVPIPEACRDRIFDVSGEGQINDLFCLADLLITDYSSDIFEFSLLQKPMLFYAFDRAEYEVERGIHGDYRGMAPGKVTESFSELLSAIRTSDFEEWRAEAYRKRHFDRIDTGNTDRVIDWILSDGMPEAMRSAGEASRRRSERIGKPWKEEA